MSESKKNTEETFAEACEKIEDTVVGAYKRIENKFAERFLTEDGELKTGKTEEAVVGTYKKIEDGVVGTYKKIEEGVVGAYKRLEGRFVDKFLSEDEE